MEPASIPATKKGRGSIEDPEVLDLESDNLFVGGAMLLSVRIDTLTPPAAVVKRLVAEKLRELGRKPGRRDKQEAKDAVKKSLRKRAFPSSRAYEVVWSLDEGRVFFFSHGKGPGEILVKVESAALNPADWKIFGPFRDRIPPPPICGLDGAGVVVALGEGVTAFVEGDRV